MNNFIDLSMEQFSSKAKKYKNSIWSKGIVSSVFAMSLMLQPYVARAADGGGTAIVAPTGALAGATNQDFDFTYTAVSDLGDGAVSMQVPSPWAAPTPTNTTVTVTNGLTGEVIDNLDNPIVAGWQQQTTGLQLVPATLAVGTPYSGTGSLQISLPLLSVLGTNQVFFNFPAAQDWSGYTHISFQVKKSALLTVNLLNAARLVLATGDNLAGSNLIPFSSTILNLAIIDTPGDWVQIVLPLGATPRSAVKSFGFSFGGTADVNLAGDISIDNIMAGPGDPIFSGNTVTQNLIYLNQGGTVEFDYHGVTVPNEDGGYTFPISEKDNGDGTLTPIASSPMVQVIDTNNGGNNGGDNGSGENDDTRTDDVDNDGGDEFAVDTDGDGCFEFFFDPDGSSVACFTVDGSQDNCVDQFLDTDSDGCQVCPEVFWDPTNQVVSQISEESVDVDGDGDLELVCAYDSDGDGNNDSFIQIGDNGPTVGGQGGGQGNPFEVNGGGCSLERSMSPTATMISLWGMASLIGAAFLVFQAKSRLSKK